ncbi:protein kinase domain-containing protein [Archangium sp.]|uniref:serine/threonine-protein kinase n=1 Tax=Archangium sp. TaxID=1872627 RepID=UPI00286A077C|nr:protein kinase [Archangium sp.]
MERLQGAPISETSPQAATPFGKYLLIKRLAVGGMAELFLAQEPPRSELVVIKRILPYLSEEPEFVQMFLDEARIAAQLHHPNVVQVFELGRINESIFIAMEYVEGVDLRRILAEETKFSAQVPYAVAARICAQVASGLDHAHNSKGVDGRPLGLIHRDVSPQNVMVAYDGSVKLVDFGIAKAEALAERSKPGVIKGKFLYLSPEQVMQEKLDWRSDLFALGVMLYEITTGRSPFARPTTEAILYAIRFEMPSPPHLIRDDYPQELSRIVMKCLTKDRNQRYQRASQVQADLETLLASGTMRGSDDVSAYIARLLGAEEERTMLHVPIPAAKKGAAPAAPAPQPAGLSARPVRRTSAENLPLAGDPDDVEFATEMARPRDMLAAAPADPSPTGPVPLGDEEEDEATAISTLPGRNSGPLAPPVPSRALPRLPTGESTVQERPSRAAAMTPARPLAARKSPLSSPSVASLDRRRGPPVDQDEQDDEASQSVSLTPATVNNRAPVRAAYLSREDDSQVEDSRGDTHSEVSDLLELSTQPQRVARMDPDDDESTAGYGGHTQTQTETQSRPERRRSRTGVLLVAVVTLVLVIAAAAAWLFLLNPARPGGPEAPVGEAPAVEETPPAATAENPPPTEPPAATGETPPSQPASGTASATASPGQEQGSAAPTSTPPTGTPPTPGAEQGGAVAPVVAEPPSATGVATQGSDTGTQSPTPVKPPSEVPVLFKAPARTSLRVVGGQSVKPNDSLRLAPGVVRIEYRCPGSRSPKLRKSFQVPENPKDPVVFRVECAPRRRR